MAECKTCGKKLPKRTVKTGRQQEYCNTTCRTKSFFRKKSEEKRKVEGKKKPVRRPVPKKTKKVSKRREIEQLKEHFDTKQISISKSNQKELNKVTDAIKEAENSMKNLVGISGERQEIAPTMPVRQPGEDALSFAERKNQWKKKYA